MKMEDETEISIIVPIYNTEKYLQDCLQSVLNQTFRNYEVICIDDASTDGSGNIVEMYAQKDNRITLCRNKFNRGQAFSRNVGIRKAKGRYIYFLDSDDMIEQGALERMYCAAEKEKLDILYFDAKIIFENEAMQKKYKWISYTRRGNYDRVFEGGDLFCKFMDEADWQASPPQQFMKKSLLLDNHIVYEEGIIHEDVLFSFMTIMSAHRCAVIPDQLFIRRFRENSTMTSPKNMDHFKGKLRCYAKILRFYMDNCCQEKYRAAIKLFLNSYLGYGLVSMVWQHPDWPDNLHGTTETEEVCLAMLAAVGQMQLIDSDVLLQLKDDRKKYIYGAGRYGKEIFAECIQKAIRIDGFILTKNDTGLKTLFGVPIIEISDFGDGGAQIIIGIKNKKMREDVIGILKGKGYGLENIIVAT